MEIITYSDGYKWVTVHYEVAKLFHLLNIEVCQLYLDEEAEGVVYDLADLEERNECGATFALDLEAVRSLCRRLIKEAAEKGERI